jgi:acetoacetyl-CoA reductase
LTKRIQQPVAGLPRGLGLARVRFFVLQDHCQCQRAPEVAAAHRPGDLTAVKVRGGALPIVSRVGAPREEAPSRRGSMEGFDMTECTSGAPRVALVTGGTAGIGAAICEALVAAGYRVAANYGEHQASADAFATRTGIPVFSWNVADLDACGAGVARVEAALGPVEVLVNNAGITRDSMLHKMSAAQWREVIDVDLGGCFNMCRSVIEGMRERRFGRIVNISSVNALSGQAGQTNYAAAKAGMIGLTKSLALEGAARNITVNAVAPGYTDTARVAAVAPQVLESILKAVPAGRLARVAEIARGVVFLVADDAAFINGTTLSINGGKYLS